MLFKSLVKINFIYSNLFQDESLSGTQDVRRCFAETFGELNFTHTSICLKTVKEYVDSLHSYMVGRYFVDEMLGWMTQLGQVVLFQ